MVLLPSLVAAARGATGFVVVLMGLVETVLAVAAGRAAAGFTFAAGFTVAAGFAAASFAAAAGFAETGGLCATALTVFDPAGRPGLRFVATVGSAALIAAGAGATGLASTAAGALLVSDIVDRLSCDYVALHNKPVAFCAQAILCGATWCAR